MLFDGLILLIGSTPEYETVWRRTDITSFTTPSPPNNATSFAAVYVSMSMINLLNLFVISGPWNRQREKNNKGELISTQPFIYLLQALKKPFLAGLRVGEAFQTTEILVSSGERTPCQLDSPNAYSGKTDFRK